VDEVNTSAYGPAGKLVLNKGFSVL